MRKNFLVKLVLGTFLLSLSIIGVVSAAGNTGDEKVHFTFQTNSPYDATNARIKKNDTKVYLHTLTPKKGKNFSVWVEVDANIKPKTPRAWRKISGSAYASPNTTYLFTNYAFENFGNQGYSVEVRLNSKEKSNTIVPANWSPDSISKNGVKVASPVYR